MMFWFAVGAEGGEVEAVFRVVKEACPGYSPFLRAFANLADPVNAGRFGSADTAFSPHNLPEFRSEALRLHRVLARLASSPFLIRKHSATARRRLKTALAIQAPYYELVFVRASIVKEFFSGFPPPGSNGTANGPVLVYENKRVRVIESTVHALWAPVLNNERLQGRVALLDRG
jgi:hypothetical protein